MFKVFLRSFSALVPKWPVTQKRFTIERNTLIFVSQKKITHTWCTIGLVVVNVPSVNLA